MTTLRELTNAELDTVAAGGDSAQNDRNGSIWGGLTGTEAAVGVAVAGAAAAVAGAIGAVTGSANYRVKCIPL